MLNRLTLIGHLGGDAELTTVKSGTHLTKFSIAVTSSVADKQHTQWFNCVIWGQRGAKVGPHLTKGKLVFIEGTLRTDDYEDREGVKRTSISVFVHDVQFLGGRLEPKAEHQAPEGGQVLKSEDPWEWSKKAEKALDKAPTTQGDLVKGQPRGRQPTDDWNDTSDIPF